jgi:MFS family permease
MVFLYSLYLFVREHISSFSLQYLLLFMGQSKIKFNDHPNFRLGSKVYSILYFARAIAANIGIIASSFILPHFGWFGCFAFFGILTILSFLLLLVFNEKPLPVKTSIKEKKAGPTGTPYSPDIQKKGWSP